MNDPLHLVDRILDDEGITGDLDEPESTALVAWLVKRAEAVATEPDAEERVAELRRLGRAVGKTVAAFRDLGIAEAEKRAAAGGIPWPKDPPKSPGDALAAILAAVESR